MREEKEILGQIEFIKEKFIYQEYVRLLSRKDVGECHQPHMGSIEDVSKFAMEMENKYGKESLVIKDESEFTELNGRLDALEWVMGRPMDGWERYCEDNPEVCGLAVN